MAKISGTADAFVDAIGQAMGIATDNYQRLIIDCQIGYPVKLYFQFVGDSRLLSLDLETLLKSAQIADLVKER